MSLILLEILRRRRTNCDYGINAHIKQHCDKNQQDRLIDLVIGNCAVDVEPQRVDTEETEDCRLSHHHLPSDKTGTRETVRIRGARSQTSTGSIRLRGASVRSCTKSALLLIRKPRIAPLCRRIAQTAGSIDGPQSCTRIYARIYSGVVRTTIRT